MNIDARIEIALLKDRLVLLRAEARRFRARLADLKAKKATCLSEAAN